MKLIVIFLLIAIASGSVSARPGIFGDFISSIKNATRSAIDNAVEKAKNFYRGILDQLSSMGNSLKNLEKKFKESQVLKWVDTAKTFVNNSEDEIKEILKIIDEKSKVLQQETGNMLHKESSVLQEWSDKILKNMGKCDKEATQAVEDLYEDASAVAAEATEHAKKIIKIFEDCPDNEDVLPCMVELPELAKKGSNLMAKKIKPMKTKAHVIDTRGTLRFSACLASVKILIEAEKSAIEKKIQS